MWCFIGDGEVDEPETLGSISLAAREQLDNLTWVINCNLQRLDGPVRGSGKIIQELEAIFRGAGWNVIKVIWGRGWDELLARDVEGHLVNKMHKTLDGHYQRLRAEHGALHPRELLRARARAAGAGRGLDRRPDLGTAPRRSRLPQDLQRLPGGDGADRRSHRDPGEDHQGLDARARCRGPQRHPSDQGADQQAAARAAQPGSTSRRTSPRRRCRAIRTRRTSVPAPTLPSTST